MQGAGRPPWLGHGKQQRWSLAHFVEGKTGEKKRLEYRIVVRVEGRSWGRQPAGGGGGGGDGLGGGGGMEGMEGKRLI